MIGFGLIKKKMYLMKLIIIVKCNVKDFHYDYLVFNISDSKKYRREKTEIHND